MRKIGQSNAKGTGHEIRLCLKNMFDVEDEIEFPGVGSTQICQFPLRRCILWAQIPKRLDFIFSTSKPTDFFR